jgi:hypothetical protein
MEAILTVRRDPTRGRLFMVSLSGFHYPGEGRLMNRDKLEGFIGASATNILIDQLDAKQEQSDG